MQKPFVNTGKANCYRLMHQWTNGPTDRHRGFKSHVHVILKKQEINIMDKKRHFQGNLTI